MTERSSLAISPIPPEETPARLPTWRSEVWQTIVLAMPLVFAQLAQIAITTTDVLMMGWLGPRYLAGGALATNLFMPTFLFGLGVITAVAPLVAQSLGARKRRAVRRTLRQGLWVALALGVPGVILLWYGRMVLLAFGQDPEIAALAEDYLRSACWALIPAFGVVAFRGFVTAHGRPRIVLVATLVGVAVNALADYVLMFGHFGFPRLELMGAGLATTIVHAVIFATLFITVVRDRHYRRYALLVRFWRPDWPRFREIFRIGLPIGLSILAETTMFAAASLLMGLLGTSQLAAHAIALQCASVAFMVPLGFSQATTVRVGVAVGARNPEAIGRAGWVSLGVGLFCLALLAASFLLGGGALMDLFLDSSAETYEQVKAFGISFLAIAALFQLVDGAQVIVAGALRGLRDTRVPMYFAVLGYWGLGVPSSVLLGFPLGLGGDGIWLGLAVGLTAVAILLVRRFHRRERLSLVAMPQFA